MLSSDDYNSYMSYFSKKYDFKICSETDIVNVVNFIDTYWKRNHALVASPKLLEWQHHNLKDGNYTFAIAIHKKTGEIHALEGYILSSQYDSNIEFPIRWPAIWKIRDDVAPPGLGLMVHLFAINEIPTNIYGAMGISDMAFPLYSELDTIGYCIQWYILHPTKCEFQLADNYVDAPRYNPLATTISGMKFVDCTNSFMDLDGDILSYIPDYKSKIYYINRYLKHPYYLYHATGIVDEKSNSVLSVFFWRFCEYNDKRCIRIVDFFGNQSSLSGQCSNFQQLLIEEDAEFIDFINVGISPVFFERAGFVNRAGTSLVLANYFEPFMLENVDVSLRYAWHSSDSRSPLFFKGDADQDRPNIIME